MITSAPQARGQVKLGRGHVERDHQPRALGLGPGDHAQPDRAAAGDHHDVLELHVAALHGVQGAGQRLGERGVGGRQVGGDLVHQGVLGIEHVLRHPARRTPLEAEHVVRRAHPILAIQAVAALPTRHDLLGDHPVADRDVPAGAGLVIDLNNCPDKLVARDHLGLGPGRPVRVPPELGRSVVALEIARADPDGFHFDQRLARAGPRDRDLLQLIVLRPVADNGFHRFWDLFGRLGSHR